MEAIHQSDMRGFEVRVLLYELPQMLVWLILAAALAKGFAFVYTNHPELGARGQQLIFGGMMAAGLAAVFWSASYFPRRVELFPDRLRFVMAFSSREVSLNAIASVRTLAPEETRKSFLSPRYVSMSPSLSGAVELRRKRGRAWVFSPADPEELVARVKARLPGAEKNIGP